MAANSHEVAIDKKWTVDELVSKIIIEQDTTHKKQLNIHFASCNKEQLGMHFASGGYSSTEIISVCFIEKWYAIRLSRLKVVGEVILKLSNLNKFDRIINVNKFAEHHVGYSHEIPNGPYLDWMRPLLSDDFTSLVSFDGFAQSDYDLGIKYIEDYDVICDMISRDKLISIKLGFNTGYAGTKNGNNIWNKETNNLMCDKSRLINAIKSTNTLKEISLDSHCLVNHKILETMLKEALQINFSVTTLISVSNMGTVIDMCKEWPQRILSAYESEWEEIIDKKVHNQYASWWPKIQKRNEESQKFNAIISGDQKDDGIWSNNQCPKHIASKLLPYHFPSIPSLAFNKKGDLCFCIKCHNQRKDKTVYKRGKPPMKYALPIEWVRFGLKTDDVKCTMANVWDEWHVAFHGTTKEVIPEIFKSGRILLKPGDITMDRKELGIRVGHIKKTFKRYNKYSKSDEIFDPNQIYMSPSIKYSAHGAYAKWVYCQHPDDKDRTIKVQFAFQLRVQPGSYKIGQETVGAAKSGLKLDVNFSNNELEWYTKHNLGIVLHGLLLHIKEVNVPTKRRKKYDISKDEDDEKGGPYSEKKGKSKAKFTAKFKYENKLYILLKMGLKIKEDRAKELLLRHDGDLNEILADIFK
eukprot:263511_1